MQEPFECYNMPDIETGLHLGRNHLIAVSLMVGNDHDLNGITGIGLETAVRFVKCFSDNEILNRLAFLVLSFLIDLQGSQNDSLFDYALHVSQVA